MTRPLSPWFDMAHEAGREWFRDNPGAPLAEFEAWVALDYEPRQLLAAGFGWAPGQLFDDKMQQSLDDAHAGLGRALVDETTRRRRRAA